MKDQSSKKIDRTKKQLEDLYSEYHKMCMGENVKGYSEGGSVQPEESTFDKAIKSIKEAFQPAPMLDLKPKEENQDQKYDRIRKENSERMQGTRTVGSYADGGQIQPIDPKKAQEVQDSMRQAFHFNNGGMVQHLNQGGLSLSPEQFQQHLEDLKTQGFNVPASADFQDPENIDVQLPKQQTNSQTQPDPNAKPASTEALTAENPDDKAIETPYKDEDLEANLKADETSPERSTASEDQSKAEESTPNDKQSAVQALMSSISQQKNGLLDAQRERDRNIALQNLEKGAALFGAGMAKTSPDKNLALINANDQYVNLPVQKYDEQIANQKNDPNSTVSQAYRDLYGKVMGQQAPANWSAADLEKVSPVFEKYMQAKETAQTKKETALLGLQQRAEAEKNRHELALQSAKDRDERMKESARHNHEMEKVRQEMVGLSGQRLGLTASKGIEQHPIVQAFDKRIESARSALDQLNDKSQPLTNNRLNAIQIDLAGTLPLLGVGTSDYKSKSDKLTNLNTKLADLKQQYGTRIVDMRKEAPEVYKEVLTFANSVKGSLDNRRKEEVQKLSSNYSQAMGENTEAGKRLKGIYNKAPAIDADLSKMSDKELQEYIKTHGK